MSIKDVMDTPWQDLMCILPEAKEKQEDKLIDLADFIGLVGKGG